MENAGYGSEENYAYLEKEEIQAVVKYGSYHKKKSEVWKENIGKIENWTYDEAEDRWTCTAGRTLYFRQESNEILDSGYEIRTRRLPAKGTLYKSGRTSGCDR